MGIEITKPLGSDVVRVGLIGAGRIGSSHAQLIAERVPGAQLVAVADPRPAAAAELAAPFGARPFADPAELIAIAAADEARVALQIALACIESVQQHAAVALDPVGGVQEVAR